jgi:hypothetical protein
MGLHHQSVYHENSFCKGLYYNVFLFLARRFSRDFERTFYNTFDRFSTRTQQRTRKRTHYNVFFFMKSIPFFYFNAYKRHTIVTKEHIHAILSESLKKYPVYR